VKLGLLALIAGVLLLIISIPAIAVFMMGGFNQLVARNISGGVLAYAPIAGVILGFILTAIGATKVFKN
jgi:hypothetical protein